MVCEEDVERGRSLVRLPRFAVEPLAQNVSQSQFSEFPMSPLSHRSLLMTAETARKDETYGKIIADAGLTGRFSSITAPT